MGIFDLYCRICNGPFYISNDKDDIFEKYVEHDAFEDDDCEIFKDEFLDYDSKEFDQLFDWLFKNAVVYFPDGTVLNVGSYITSEGVSSLTSGEELQPTEYHEHNANEFYWNGIAVHKKCLDLAQLAGANDYNRLFFDTVFTGDGHHNQLAHPVSAVEKDNHKLSYYTGQDFFWGDFLTEGTDIRYILEDPDINSANKDRIIKRGQDIRLRPLNTKFYHVGTPFDIEMDVNGKKIMVTVPHKYSVASILTAGPDIISRFSKIFGTDDPRTIVNILNQNNLLVGPMQNMFKDQPMSKEYLNYSSVYFMALMF